VARPAVLVVVALTAVLVVAGCGGGTGSGATGIAPGALADLPRLDGSRELPEAGDTVGRGFVREAATPLDVLRFYRFELPRTGWEQIGTVDAVGAGALRGRWWRGDLLLEVSAGYPPTTDTEVATEGPAVEYSLVLRPVDAP